jgi:hypothetical protein
VLAQPDTNMTERPGLAIWLAAIAPPLAADAPALDQVVRERWKAVAATLGGDIAAGREHAARALAAASSVVDRLERTPLHDVATLPAVIELYTPGPVTYTIPTREAVPGRWLHNFGGLLLRSGAPPVQGTRFRADDVYTRALETAARGDGTALAACMDAHHDCLWTDADVMAVLPRITTGREAVVRQLVWAVPEHNRQLELDVPWATALHAAARRAALHVAGEDAEAARWTEIYHRYDQALRDRRKLVALALWEQ